MAETEAGPTGDVRKEDPANLLPALREALGGDAASVPDAALLKFLHWKRDVARAAGRHAKLASYRRANPWAFRAAGEDGALRRVLLSEVVVAPDGMVDLEGRAVLLGRMRKNDMSDGRTAEDVVRMIVYTVDRLMERPEASERGVIVFHDLRGLAKRNVDPGIPKLLFEAIFGHFPLRIQGIYFLDAPLFFRMMFKVIGLLMPKKIRDRAHFVRSIDEVPIDRAQLLEEHGGERTHDQAAWVERQVGRERDGSIESIVDGIAAAD